MLIHRLSHSFLRALSEPRDVDEGPALSCAIGCSRGGNVVQISILCSHMRSAYRRADVRTAVTKNSLFVSTAPFSFGKAPGAYQRCVSIQRYSNNPVFLSDVNGRLQTGQEPFYRRGSQAHSKSSNTAWLKHCK